MAANIVALSYIAAALFVCYRALEASQAMTWRTRQAIRCTFILIGTAAFSECLSSIAFLLYGNPDLQPTLGNVAFMCGVSMFFSFDRRRWYRVREIANKMTATG